MYDYSDDELVVKLASGGPCSLAKTPEKDNWVDHAGGLPPYICKIARAIARGGKSTSSAIAIAVSRVKKWAAGTGDVNADTRAKAAKAVAQWEALKAKSKAKKSIKASHPDGAGYIILSDLGSFNTDMVRRAWDAQERERRAEYEEANTASRDIAAPSSVLYPYRWITEVWSDFLIVEAEDVSELSQYLKVPYTVSGGTIEFGEPTTVIKNWVEADDFDDELTDAELEYLSDLLKSTGDRDLAEKLLNLDD